MKLASRTPLALALIVSCLAPASPQRLGQDYVICIAEMDQDLALFEVFLPETQANRKNVVHQVLDDAQSAVATEKFGTADGHYKIAMVGSYGDGRQYTLVIDGKYRLEFVFRAGKKDTDS